MGVDSVRPDVVVPVGTGFRFLAGSVANDGVGVVVVFDDVGAYGHGEGFAGGEEGGGAGVCDAPGKAGLSRGVGDFGSGWILGDAGDFGVGLRVGGRGITLTLILSFKGEEKGMGSP